MNTNDDILLDINSLLAGEWTQLQYLLTGCYGEGKEGNINPEQLAAAIHGFTYRDDHSLLENLQKNLSDEDALNSDSFSLVAFVDQLFNNYLKNSKLHPIMQQTLNAFRPAILHSLCQQKLPWKDCDNPARYFRFLLPGICGWQPELGRAAEKFLQQLKPLLEELTEATDSTIAAEAVTALEQFLEREQQRIGKLEQRLRDAEIGQLHAKHAQQLSAKTLNQQMGGKKLPVVISQFLQGPWRESMRLLIINKGKDSDQWRKMVRLTETLIWSFQPIGADEPDEKHQHIYQSISELSEELRETTIGLHHTSELDEQLAKVEAEHLKILKGKNLDYEPFKLIENTDPLLNTQVSVSKTLIKNVAQFEQGQWFIYHANEGEKRIKLTIKIDQAQQLLFTNFIGIKVEQFNYEEFAYMLSSKIVAPLNSRDRFRATGEKVLQSLLQRFHQQQQTIASEKAIEEEILRQQDIARELARTKALEEAKAHAIAAADARKKAEQDEQFRQQQLERQQRSEDFSAQVEKIQLGGRVSFINQAGEEVPCRLAAILQSSGEYVFVDRSGIKHKVTTQQQLTELLVDSQARIIDQGSDFGNTLEQVVNNLRTRKKT